MGGHKSQQQDSKTFGIIKHKIHSTGEPLERLIRCYQCSLSAHQNQPTLNTSVSPMNTRLKQTIRRFRIKGMNDFQILHWLQKAYGKHIVCNRLIPWSRDFIPMQPRQNLSVVLFLRAKVYLNVYDLKSWLNCCECVGIGAYHTAVEINGIEYMYWGTGAPACGILEIQPESMREFHFSRKVEMGEIYMPLSEFLETYNDIKKRFIGSKYDLLSRNCNHFSEVFISRLLGVSLPRYIFRMSDFLENIRCLIPDCLLGPRGMDPFEKLNRNFLGLPPPKEEVRITHF